MLILVGVFPSWPHSRGWGYGLSGFVSLLLLVLLVPLLMGRVSPAGESVSPMASIAKLTG